MALMEKYLVVKESSIPGSGKGLFTLTDIPKGTDIVEYKGRVTDWKNAHHKDGNNAYLFYVNRNVVIDALKKLSALARYANDGKGITRMKGVYINCEYVTRKNKVFIRSVKNIKAGSEILVSYGKEYWDVIKKNQKD